MIIVYVTKYYIVESAGTSLGKTFRLMPYQIPLSCRGVISINATFFPIV